MMKKKHSDMSVQACADRFNKKRADIIEGIRQGVLSSTMSSIEYYVADFHELSEKGDFGAIEVAMTWNGVEHIDRPNWRAEYNAWLKERCDNHQRIRDFIRDHEGRAMFVPTLD